MKAKIPGTYVMHAFFLFTYDIHREGTLSRISGQIRCPDFDQSRTDLELRGRRQRRNADHTWTVSGIV
jgi:hypothetical protein